MPKTLFIFAENEADLQTADSVYQALNTQFGHYAVSSYTSAQALPTQSETAIHIRSADIPRSPNSLNDYLSRLVTHYLTLESSDLSCRPDHAELDSFRTPEGALDVTRDPRPWILGNPFISELATSQPKYRNLVDFVTEVRGLSIKPAQYANQRNYWNSATNAGLPIVKKRDATHEGTFMLHDLFHFAIQDPIPYALHASANSEALHRTYVMHRIASEATTLALADMVAVGDANLEQTGYDVNKRRIYPIYRDIRTSNPTVSRDEILDANFDFCFTGNTDLYHNLGAGIRALADFSNKYEVFFSADFDWNSQNFWKSYQDYLHDPRVREYVKLAHHAYGIPTIDSLYPNFESIDLDEIKTSFKQQVTQALEYRSTDDELSRLITAGTKYLAGQMLMFCKFDKSNRLKTHFLDISKSFMMARSISDALAAYEESVQFSQALLNNLQSTQQIRPQDHKLFMMHYPTYPAQFIHYDKDAADYRNLAQKIGDLVDVSQLGRIA